MVIRIQEYSAVERRWRTAHDGLQVLPRYFSRKRDVCNEWGNPIRDIGRVRMGNVSSLVIHFESGDCEVIEVVRGAR